MTASGRKHVETSSCHARKAGIESLSCAGLVPTPDTTSPWRAEAANTRHPVIPMHLSNRSNLVCNIREELAYLAAEKNGASSRQVLGPGIQLRPVEATRDGRADVDLPADEAADTCLGVRHKPAT